MTNVLTSAVNAFVFLTTRIVNFIGGHEGFVSKAYLDPVNILTIGYGFTMRSKVFATYWKETRGRGLKKGDTISKAEAHKVLLALLAEEYAPPVDAKLRRVVPRIQEAALSFVFNAGPGALSWKWAAALVRGDLAEAARLWRVTATTAKGKSLPGLVRRRREEADIAEFDRWPSWVTGLDSAPETHVESVDIRQAQLWLNSLGYDLGAADGIPGMRTVNATKRFQTDHGNLKVDGIIGPATLAALRRAIDLKSKTVVTVGTGGTVAGGGVVENTTGAAESVSDVAGIGDWLLWGGLGVTALVLAYFAWRYRDELVVAFKKL
jgi:lysozyme